MTVFSFLNLTLTNGNLPPVTPLLGLAVRGANLPPGTSVSLYSAEQALPPRASARTTPTLDLSASLALLAGAVQSPFVPLDTFTPYPVVRRDVSFAGARLPLTAASDVPFFGSADVVPARPQGRLIEAFFGFNPANFPQAATPFSGLVEGQGTRRAPLSPDASLGVLPSSLITPSPFFGLADPLPPRRAVPQIGMTAPGLMLSTPTATPFFGAATALPIRRVARAFEVYGRIGPPPFPPLAGDEFMISLTWAAWPQL